MDVMERNTQYPFSLNKAVRRRNTNLANVSLNEGLVQKKVLVSIERRLGFGSLTLQTCNLEKKDVIRSNAIGTMFTLYDCGANPKKSNNTSDIRQELAAVIYVSKFPDYSFHGQVCNFRIQTYWDSKVHEGCTFSYQESMILTLTSASRFVL